MIRTYSELICYSTLEDRFKYLELRGAIGDVTFGFDRWLNQKFYRTYEWQAIRNEVILRDQGNDLGVDGYPIRGMILIHHMNPITKKDILERTDYLLNPEYLISVSKRTHDAIHYGNIELLEKPLVVRRPNDTIPWR